LAWIQIQDRFLGVFTRVRSFFVAQVFNLLCRRLSAGNLSVMATPADWKSAIQQVGNCAAKPYVAVLGQNSFSHGTSAGDGQLFTILPQLFHIFSHQNTQLVIGSLLVLAVTNATPRK
jgi:hypothetical protein